MAKRYGIGATSGRTASIFEATAPDGSILRKRDFFIKDESAFIAAFIHQGKWVASGVVKEKRDWGEQVFLTAKRIK